MVPRLIARLALTVPLAALLFVGCEHSGTTGPVLGSLAFLTVTPNPQAFTVGGPTTTFQATGKDANGNAVAIPAGLTWTTVAGGGTIGAGTGVFTPGNLVGTFANTVKACSTAACAAGSISGFATVSVSSGPLFSITVIPNPTTMVTGTSQTFSAVGRDAQGNLAVITPAPYWTVVTAASGSIPSPATGAFTAGATPGTYTNTVKVTNGVAGTVTGFATVTVVAGGGVLATITVTPNPATLFTGDTVRFTATGYDPSNPAIVVALPALTWSVNPAIGGGTIVGGTGLLAGTALFTAGTVTGTFTNTVKAITGGAAPVSGVATVIVVAVPPPGPSLGTAETHGLLAGSTFTCAGTAPNISTINADASVWPGTAITGFPPCIITGARHAGDAFAQTAQGDLTSAYLALAAMACGTTITADLGGTTLAPGVYCSGSSVGVTGTVTLNGPANALFVIRAPSTLTTAGNVVMSGGARASNVYWWVGSDATIGTGSLWQGNILALSSITLVDNATLCGRALARNGAVTLGAKNVIKLPPLLASTCP